MRHWSESGELGKDTESDMVQIMRDKRAAPLDRLKDGFPEGTAAAGKDALDFVATLLQCGDETAQFPADMMKHRFVDKAEQHVPIKRRNSDVVKHCLAFSRLNALQRAVREASVFSLPNDVLATMQVRATTL